MDDAEDYRDFAAARLPALQRSAFMLCGDAHLAEDLVQETLTRIYVVWGKRVIHDPVAYSHVTLTRVFLSMVRRRSAGERPVAEFPDEGRLDPDVSEAMALRAALDRLRPLDRAIVVLRYLEDRPADEVAAIVRKSPGNVRVRASRALSSMRSLLAEDETTRPQEAR